jgi:hypothetical protein
MSETKKLETEVAALRKRAHDAPRSLPGAPSTAWARHSREWMGAVDRLAAAKAKEPPP